MPASASRISGVQGVAWPSCGWLEVHLGLCLSLGSRAEKCQARVLGKRQLWLQSRGDLKVQGTSEVRIGTAPCWGRLKTADRWLKFLGFLPVGPDTPGGQTQI